jgi:hypothetical protein
MNDPLADLRQRTARRHNQIGWWGLLLFLSLGIALETLHGFKAASYLDPPHALRRLLWTLAHAHGTLLALVHLVFAAGLGQFGLWTERRLKLASFLLLDALVLLPAGFFLGGLGHTEVDPGPGVLLVPLGALALLTAVGLIAWSTMAKARLAGSNDSPRQEPQHERTL